MCKRDPWGNLIGWCHWTRTTLVIFLIIVGVGLTLGHSIYVALFEFETARAEWDAAYAQHNQEGMWKAYRKEQIAHCRTGDMVGWLFHDTDYCNPTVSHPR